MLFRGDSFMKFDGLGMFQTFDLAFTSTGSRSRHSVEAVELRIWHFAACGET